jgi:hypothetical protein
MGESLPDGAAVKEPTADEEEKAYIEDCVQSMREAVQRLRWDLARGYCIRHDALCFPSPDPRPKKPKRSKQ